MSEKDTGPAAGVKGVVEGVKGKAKEVIGAVTGKDELRREGEAQGEKAGALRDVAVKEVACRAAPLLNAGQTVNATTVGAVGGIELPSVKLFLYSRT